MVADVKDYLDASAIIPIFVGEPTKAAVLELLDDAPAAPQFSDLSVAEVSSAVSRLVRTKRLALEAANAALSDFDEWAQAIGQPVEVYSSDFREATLLVRQFELKLRTPDALHLTICRRLGARMVTLDRRLAQAARDADVACINPAEDSAYRKTE